MAFNYLGITNDILARFNEAPLTSATFSTVDSGSYRNTKDSVNSSIRHINQGSFEWPFNFVEQEDTLTAGTSRYPYPSDAKSISFDTFRIKRDATFGNETQFLSKMDYEEYIQKHVVDEYNTSDTGIRGLPKRIIRTPNQELVVHPVPDKAYEMVYEYYGLPVDLVLYTDVPNIPTAFRHIIVDGAAYYSYIFRSDYESADRVLQKFTDGIENMRTIYINRYEYVRDTRRSEGYGYQNALRTN